MHTSHSESKSGLVVELAEEFLERYRAVSGQHFASTSSAILS